MVRVAIRTYFYDEYGGVGNDIFVKDVETLDMAKDYVYNVNNNRAYKYDIDIRLSLKPIDKIVLNLKSEGITQQILTQQFIEKWDGKTPLYGNLPVTLFKQERSK